VSARAGQAGTDALAQAGKVVDDARSRGASVGGDVKDQVMSAADGQREGLAEQVSDVAYAIHQAGEHFKGRTGSRASSRPGPLNFARWHPRCVPTISKDWT
jgi:hypothetical protein